MEEVTVVDVILNPIAGKGRSLQAFETVKRIFAKKNIAYTLHETTCRGDSSRILQELAGKATDILAMGGDGTFHEIINGFVDFNCNLALLPCGTGNDFSASLGIPEDPEAALSFLTEGKPQFVDFFETPFCRGLNAIGAGMDVDVMYRYNKHKNHTKGTYLRSLISSLVHYKPYRFTVTVDGKTASHRCFIVAVGNGRRIGGGIPMCPAANPFDGKLDVVIVNHIKKIVIPFAFMKLMKGKILTLKKTEFVRTEEVKVQSETPITVQVDGELYEDVDFTVRVVRDKLKIYRI